VRDAEKNDFTECATINDLTMMKCRETPKNQALTILKGFSTVSADTERSDLEMQVAQLGHCLQTTFPFGEITIRLMLKSHCSEVDTELDTQHQCVVEMARAAGLNDVLKVGLDEDGTLAEV